MSEIPRPKLQLVYADEVMAELEVAPGDDLVLGRGDGADLEVPHPTVADVHARVYSDGGDVFLDDAGSKNGSYIDGRPVRGVMRLRDGQRVLLGQQDVAKPYWVRLDDPSERLLAALGVPEQAAAGELDGAAEAEPLGDDGAADLPEEAPPAVPRFDRRRVAVGSALVAVLFVVACWGLLTLLRPTAQFWRSVQVYPPVAEVGGELVVRSPDIHPSDRLDIFIGGEKADTLDIHRGQLRVQVPGLASARTGFHDLPLVVRRNEREIYQRVTRFVVRPQVERVSPAEVEVGERLVLHGSGFGSASDGVQVRLAGRLVPALAAAPDRVEVRVPPVTGREGGRIPVEVVIGEWEAATPELVAIAPRPDDPLEFRLTAEWAEDRSAWLVSHPFGPAFYLSGPPPGGKEGEGVSGPVAAALARWEEAFRLAARDPSLRIEVRERSGRQLLLATGSTIDRPLELAAWEAGELAQLADPQRTDLSSDMLVHWMAGTWNHFLDTFGRGRTIDGSTSPPAHVAVLNRLVSVNRASGGSGRPESPDLERLAASERTVLAQAMLPVPRLVGTVAGTWHAQLENVFYGDHEFQVELELEVRQQGRELSGRGHAYLRSATMEWSLKPSSLRGRLLPGRPPEVSLEAWFGPPLGGVELSGALREGVLAGTFTGGGGRNRGPRARWSAYRSDGPGGRGRLAQDDGLAALLAIGRRGRAIDSEGRGRGR